MWALQPPHDLSCCLLANLFLAGQSLACAHDEVLEVDSFQHCFQWLSELVSPYQASVLESFSASKPSTTAPFSAICLWVPCYLWNSVGEMLAFYFAFFDCLWLTNWLALVQCKWCVPFFLFSFRAWHTNRWPSRIGCCIRPPHPMLSREMLANAPHPVALAGSVVLV